MEMPKEWSDLNANFARSMDESMQVLVGRMTNGLSPLTPTLAYLDWSFHLLAHPGKQFELWKLYSEYCSHITQQFLNHLKGDETGEYVPLSIKGDRRFADARWQQFPYTAIYESFLFAQNWWNTATTSVRGVSKHHEEIVEFSARQILDMLSPTNFMWTNPEIQDETIKQQGKNIVRGFENFWDDYRRQQAGEPPFGAEKYVVGKTVGVTPGKVIYRNRLIELIQYSPTTNSVYAEPILITPAWIMKYYILDLSHKHSLVRYLVRRGHTVFMISWKNPTGEDRDLTMDDYMDLGIMASINAINAIVPNQKVHLVGYCLGGTLSAITTATMARDKDERLATMTLFAAQTDFSEPGELGLFIDDSQISFLEHIMSDKGYLDTNQMAGAFQMLRSNDLVWSRIVKEYYLGDRRPLNDLMAWNADATRLPYRMHSEYLRNLFLTNQLAEAKYKAHGKPIALSDIHIPIFVVATERDHVSPWKSVFKIHLLANSPVTFALTSGGHNVGIVSIPSKTTKRHYRISHLKEKDRYIDADSWYHEHRKRSGSWWPAFEKWLAHHSQAKIAPPTMGNENAGYPVLEDAPGQYVLQK